MIRRIDLHIHTTNSDGSLTPKQVIDEAYKNNVDVIAIADHDTTNAYTDELLKYAQSKNIKLINAVEISTKTSKAGIHVLGYNFDLDNENMQEFLYQTRNARHIYLKEVSEKLLNLGYTLNVEELDKIDAVSKAHIALDIINNLIKTIGSDFHVKDGIRPEIGFVNTDFHLESNNIEEIILNLTK